MIPHGHQPAHARDKEKPSHPQMAWHKGIHKDWRTWLVIGLMLAAMGIYVLTLDDSIQPGGGAPVGVPASPSR
jgi:hypothetical protein